ASQASERAVAMTRRELNASNSAWGRRCLGDPVGGLVGPEPCRSHGPRHAVGSACRHRRHQPRPGRGLRLPARVGVRLLRERLPPLVLLAARRLLLPPLSPLAVLLRSAPQARKPVMNLSPVSSDNYKAALSA